MRSVLVVLALVAGPTVVVVVALTHDDPWLAFFALCCRPSKRSTSEDRKETGQ